MDVPRGGQGLVPNSKGRGLAAADLSSGCENEFILCKEKFLETNEHRLPSLEGEEKLQCLYKRTSKRNSVILYFFTSLQLKINAFHKPMCLLAYRIQE